MSTRSENTVIINQPIDKVHKALTTREYWDFIVAKLSPVDFKGDITYKSQDETTVLDYVSEVSVNIPMMGAAIEPKVAEALQELYTNEGKLTEEWISNNL